MTTSLWAFLATLAATCLITPFVRRAALIWGVVDKPDQHRKLHRSATPLCGGVAVLLGLLVGIPITLLVTRYAGLDLGWNGLGALLCASVLICLLGLADDAWALRGRQKFLGQIACGALVMSGGLVIEDVQVLDWNLELGILAMPFTMFWLLGAINALNLIDGMDGLATSVGIILSMALGAMAFLTGHVSDAVISFALAGSLCGFLIFNFPPARMFLGDAGSMLIGLLLGVLAIRSSLKGPATVALTVPTALWAVPILDVTMAILRRKLTGRSIYSSDRSHLHHCLQERGLDRRGALLAIGLMCAVTAVGALLSVAWNNEFLALGSALTVVGLLIVSGFFGYRECLLLGRKLALMAGSFIPRRRRTMDRTMTARLQGSREWDLLWSELLTYANRFDLDSIRLNVNLPALHEEFHADWFRRGSSEDRRSWETDLPLMANNMPVGRLRVRGSCPEAAACAWIGDLVSGLQPFEQIIGDMLSSELEHLRQTTEGAVESHNESRSASQQNVLQSVSSR